jgi:hypothetical protein
LTQAEKHDELLLKNHHKRPVGLAPPPEVHNVQKNTRNKFNGSFSKNKTGKHKHNRRQRPNQTRGRGTMRNLKMIINVIDVEIFRIFPRIVMHLSIWFCFVPKVLKGG